MSQIAKKYKMDVKDVEKKYVEKYGSIEELEKDNASKLIDELQKELKG